MSTASLRPLASWWLGAERERADLHFPEGRGPEERPLSPVLCSSCESQTAVPAPLDRFFASVSSALVLSRTWSP